MKKEVGKVHQVRKDEEEEKSPKESGKNCRKEFNNEEPFSVRVTRPVIQGSSESLHTLAS